MDAYAVRFIRLLGITAFALLFIRLSSIYIPEFIKNCASPLYRD